MSRIIVEVPTEIHHQIKAMASLRGETIKEFVLEKIFAGQKKVPNKETLKAMKNVLEKKNLKKSNNLKELYEDLGI